MSAKLPDVAEQATDSDTAAALRALRPAAPTRIERRVAIAAILSARDHGAPMVQAGRLQIQQKLGEGAMGIVYRAYDPELERTVAVKVLRQQAEEQAKKRLRAEARALARLSHPCVVAVYGLESSEGDTFVSMEYVPGDTLRKWLGSHPNAGWREVLTLFLRAAEGLAAAHDAGVIHQDFKPENVLVGQDGRVRVADFGLAWVEVRDTELGAPSSRIIGGTPHFMAPEVVVGALPSALSDQYSFCVALRDAVPQHDELKSVERQLVEQLRGIVSRGLERDPARRWGDMHALIAALRRLLVPGADDVQRTLLLQRVEELWLTTVLTESLAGAEPLAIRLEALFPEDLKRFSLSEGAGVEGRLAADRSSADPEQLRFARRVEARSILELDDLFDAAGRSLSILGAAGAGKTTALLALTRSLLRRAQVDFEQPVPVVLSLAGFDDSPALGKQALLRWIAAEIHTKYGVPTRWATRWLQEKSLVLMFDGLDEVDAARQAACVAALNAYLTSDACAGCVLTCRENVYADLDPPPAVGASIRVAPVHEALAQAVLRRFDAQTLLEHWPNDASLRELLTNPLMLQLAASAEFRELEVPQSAVLRRKLYGHFVAHLLRRVADSPERRVDLARGLVALAQGMIRTGSSDVWLERLQVAWLRDAADRTRARWLGVLVIALGIFSIGCVGLRFGGSSWPIAGVASLFGVVACFASVRTTEVRTVEGVRWLAGRTLRWLPVGLVIGVLTGAGMAARYWFAEGAAVEPNVALEALLIELGRASLLGLLGAFAMGLAPGDQAARTEPGEGLRDSLNTALAIAIPGALVCAVGTTFVVCPWMGAPSRAETGVGVGLLVGVVLFFSFGGAGLTYHWVLRWMLARHSGMPFGLKRFLARGAHSGILRRVGGGHLFMHRTLRDYFASLDEDALTALGATGGAQRTLTPKNERE
ncbi:MAG: protein kinase [Polyangiaceae bacterium]